MRCFTINHLVLPGCSAEVGPTGLSCYTHMLLASLSGAVPRHKAVISPVRVNLAAGELSRWLPADYSLVLRSSWPSPAEHDAGEKWTMTPPPPSKFQVNAGERVYWRGVRGRERLKKE